MKNYSLLITVLLSAFCLSAEAKVRAQCECRHAKSQQVFPLTVDFLSGGELAKLTNDNRFHPTGAYAIVWIGKGKNAVVKLDGQYFSNPTKKNEIKTSTTYQGGDFKGVAWQLKPVDFSTQMREGKAIASYTGQGSQQARRQAQRIGDTYPGGQQVQVANKFYYPNGQELNDLAALYYPNGKNRSIQGRNYYPNGQQVSSQGQFFYPNGKRLTSGSSAGQEPQYLSESGKKLSRAPRNIKVKDGAWTYYFQVYNGLVNVEQFTADFRSQNGTISISVSGGEIQQAVLR